MPSVQTSAKKRLGQKLGQLREDSGMRLTDAAKKLRVADSVVSRYESGWTRPLWPAVQALLLYYGASPEEEAEVEQLWQLAETKATRIATPPGAAPAYRTLLRAEQEADKISQVAGLAIPGLAQTEAYASAIQAAGRPFHHSDRAKQYVTTRLNRAARLTGPEPLKLHMVLNELHLRMLVGGPEVTIEQLRHLIHLSERDNITIQVIPFDEGAYGTMSSGFSVIEYADDYDTAVYIEYAAGSAWVENQEDVRRFETSLTESVDKALTVDESIALIHAQVRALERR